MPKANPVLILGTFKEAIVSRTAADRALYNQISEIVPAKLRYADVHGKKEKYLINALFNQMYRDAWDKEISKPGKRDTLCNSSLHAMYDSDWLLTSVYQEFINLVPLMFVDLDIDEVETRGTIGRLRIEIKITTSGFGIDVSSAVYLHMDSPVRAYSKAKNTIVSKTTVSPYGKTFRQLAAYTCRTFTVFSSRITSTVITTDPPPKIRIAFGDVFPEFQMNGYLCELQKINESNPLAPKHRDAYIDWVSYSLKQNSLAITKNNITNEKAFFEKLYNYFSVTDYMSTYLACEINRRNKEKEFLITHVTHSSYPRKVETK